MVVIRSQQYPIRQTKILAVPQMLTTLRTW